MQWNNLTLKLNLGYYFNLYVRITEKVKVTIYCCVKYTLSSLQTYMSVVIYNFI